MGSRLDGTLAQPRFQSRLLGIFASVAVLLTAVGLYGMLAYSVAQRTHEIGIRTALGAQHGDVLRLIIGQGMTVVFLGIVAGLGGAFAASRLLRDLLFETSATDPFTYAAVAGALALVAILACWIPARRAARVDPLTALRYE
jgi:putative ABC transport system permease protein